MEVVQIDGSDKNSQERENSRMRSKAKSTSIAIKQLHFWSFSTLFRLSIGLLLGALAVHSDFE